jgi:hypothetical protein
MANYKIDSYIKNNFTISSNVTKEDEVSSKFFMNSSINKSFQIKSYITISENTHKKAYNLDSYIKPLFTIESNLKNGE